MSIGRPGSESAVRAASILTLALLLACDATRAGATPYTWNNIAGGYAVDGANWSPNGVPGALDDVNFNLLASFPVVWASPADTLQSLTVVNSQPRFTITGSLGVRTHPLLENNSSLAVFGGRISGPSWSMIENNANASLSLTGPTTQALALASSTTSLFGAKGGTAGLIIYNGAVFQSAGEISLAPNGTTMTVEIGQAGAQRSLLATTTTGVPGRGWIAVGDYGQATLTLGIGGKLSPAGDLFIGRHPTAWGQVQLQTNPGQVPLVDARGQVFIGANDETAIAGGNALVDSRLGTFSSLGRCWLGDPDDPPPTDPAYPSARLLVEGGTAVFAGGLTMSAVGSGRLELRGGATHVIGGTVDLRQASPFEIGISTGNNPVLFLENGTTNDIWAPDTTHLALGLGRGGAGRLNLAGAGTTLTLHGALVMGDSLGGNGILNADSASTVIVQGKIALGSVGAPQITARGAGTTVTLQDSVAIGTGGTQQALLNATSSATVHLQKPVTIGAISIGALYCTVGAQVDAAGITTGPANGGFIVGLNNAQLTVSDHLDLTGASYAEVDIGGTLSYTNAARAASVGPKASFIVSEGSLAHFAGEFDVRGQLYMEPSGTSGLTSGPPGFRLAFPGPGRPMRPEVDALGLGGRLEGPLTRILDYGRAIAVGTIAGRFHIDSGTGRLQVSNDNQYSTGHLIAGDSTKTDGFVSIGAITVGLDTLRVLDLDGGDLGKMTIAGGRLQLPKPGHLKSGFLLSGYGTVEGSLDVRDSAWVSLQGTISGDLALAGTLDLNSAAPLEPVVVHGPPTLDAPAGTELVRTLSLGSLHVAGTGLAAVQIGTGGQDQITVGDAAVLGGTLDVRTPAGQAPGIGNLFTVLTAASVTGTFANVTVNGHPNPGTISVVYGANNVRVVVVGAIADVGDPPVATVAAPTALRFAALGGPRDAVLALDLPTASSVRVSVFDVGGRQVMVLADAELEPGRHRFELGREALGSGMYFARAELRGSSGTRVLTARVVMLR